MGLCSIFSIRRRWKSERYAGRRSILFFVNENTYEQGNPKGQLAQETRPARSNTDSQILESPWTGREPLQPVPTDIKDLK